MGGIYSFTQDITFVQKQGRIQGGALGAEAYKMAFIMIFATV
jgi:hypothetical protein